MGDDGVPGVDGGGRGRFGRSDGMADDARGVLLRGRGIDAERARVGRGEEIRAERPAARGERDCERDRADHIHEPLHAT